MPPSPVLSLEDLAGRLVGRPALLGRTRLVCVDGPAGSGKTTLANALQAQLADAVVVHMDDVYRGWDTDFDEVHQRLREQLVDPLREDRTACYQRYDWHAGRFDAWVSVPPPEVLLLEGVASAHVSLDPVTSMLVWIEVDRSERVRRGLERDGPEVLPRWLAWMAHEEIEHERQRTRERAHLRLRGDGPVDRFVAL
ncbi:MAG: AAA family ATPase [Actinomycetota bacterium]|nr:AAA family ATPase [Actinomycetota bacterium]